MKELICDWCTDTIPKGIYVDTLVKAAEFIERYSIDTDIYSIGWVEGVIYNHINR